MTISSKSQKIISQLHKDTPKMGDLKKRAKEIKKDHDLALDLWSTGEYYPRLLAILIMDKKLLSQEFIDEIANDMKDHEYAERNQMADWLMANQLSKDKKTISLMEGWEHNESAILRRIFWYHQARLRWTGKTPPENTHELLSSLEKDMSREEPEVQWTMNFAAAQIGLYETEYRSRCIALGEKLGLYKGTKVAKGCTSPFLPLWIETELAKLNNNKKL